MATSPPLSKRRLSRLLRESREAAGLTADQVTSKARELGAARWSASKITRLERDEWVRPKLEDVEVLLDIYGVTELAEREEYIRLAKEARQKGWWSSYTDVLGQGELTGLEPGASRIREVALTVVPGLLQTQGYARAVVVGGGIADQEEVERRVEARMLRQRILDPQAEGPTYWCILDEAALRKIPESVREQQIRHLVSVQRPNLRVQILPDSAGLHAAVSGGFTILDFAEDSGLVYTENAAKQQVYEDMEDTEAFELVYQYVSASALSVQESTVFLESVLADSSSKESVCKPTT
ncbi:helix-turn-helix domain-containing protein [Nocardiopsis algeriensis]|uniref:Transcriptional regulator with XRE-family HTH domain n=1 Tax=Nocardiopsis algeriensis TaxID=1478215 RepID=A0A841IUF5_9ACTN|nr:helix-turn-helix transcriptional regulator [Nocardiopsis algeriensis]MBB6121812.1 transcriptional regulator with XRE-family HTH domain [Nocardiopsis algeriensis]